MPAAISLAMSATTSGREISRLGCNAGFLSARIAFLSFIRAVFGLSAAGAALYSAKRTLRFLRHFITASFLSKREVGRRLPETPHAASSAAGRSQINPIPNAATVSWLTQRKNSSEKAEKTKRPLGPQVNFH